MSLLCSRKQAKKNNFRPNLKTKKTFIFLKEFFLFKDIFDVINGSNFFSQFLRSIKAIFEVWSFFRVKCSLM